ARLDAGGDRTRSRRHPVLRSRRRDCDRAGARPGPRRRARRRHTRWHRPPPHRLPRGDRAGGRVLPRHRQARAPARRPGHRRRPGGDRGGPPPARRRGAGVIIRKTADEIERIAQAGALVAETIAYVGERIEPGITTAELDRIADRFIRDRGGIPTSMGYKGYPAAICISPNAVVVHGIPGGHRVQEGDVITIDVGATLAGYIADSAYTFAVGRVDGETQRLLDVRQH